MEYSPIPQLNVNLRPGTKVRIIGPVKCINHVLFLESKNIEVLGGEVDTLLIINAFENMLLKTLKKPINPYPKSEYTGMKSTHPVQNGTLDDPVPNVNSSVNGMRTIDTYMPPTRTPATCPIITIEDDPFEDSDILAQVDLDALTAQHAKPETSRKVANAPRPSRTTFDSDFEDDPDDLDALAQLEEEILAEQAATRLNSRPEQNANQTRKRPSTSPVPGTSKSFMYSEPLVLDQEKVVQASKVPKLEGLDDYDLDDEFDLMVASAMNILTPPAVVQKPVAQLHTTDYKYRLEGCNLLTFTQLKQIPDSDKADQTFMFYADAKFVTKPLVIAEDRWSLELNLEDEPESDLSVSITPELLDKMIGVTASEVKLMRKKAKTQPELKEEIFVILKNFNDLLKNERKFWKIKFAEDVSGESKPTVISVTNLKTVYRRILLNKIEAECLDKLKATVPN